MITHNPMKGLIDYVAELQGLEPRGLRLQTADGVSLAAWEFRNEAAPATVILVHGWCAQKELLDRQIVFLYREGYDVVAIDLRNHGASDETVTSMGLYETRDVAAAVAHVRATEALAQRIVLWGISMGAVASVRYAVEDPSVNALIVESAYLNLRQAVWRHANLYFGRIVAMLTPIVFWVARWRAKMDIDEMDVEKTVRNVKTPSVLFVASEEDRRTPPWMSKRLCDACPSPGKRLFIAPHGKHALIFHDSERTYTQAIRKFLAEALEARQEHPRKSA
jgi:alpha-beta hydrolase superfamily lysophospholipase